MSQKPVRTKYRPWVSVVVRQATSRAQWWSRFWGFRSRFRVSGLDPHTEGWMGDSNTEGWIGNLKTQGWIGNPNTEGWIGDPDTEGWVGMQDARRLMQVAVSGNKVRIERQREKKRQSRRARERKRESERARERESVCVCWVTFSGNKEQIERQR